jgi:hypothetical protein
MTNVAAPGIVVFPRPASPRRTGDARRRETMEGDARRIGR